MKLRYASTFLVVILFLSNPQFTIKTSDTEHLISHPTLISEYYTVCSPITIDSNQDFGGLSFSGTGAQDNPYVIERLHIVSTGSHNSSISVSDTSVYLIIRDCYVETDWAGIEIRDVAEGTIRIVNNTCTSNSGGGAGIVFWGVQNCTIIDNRCSQLAQGIHLIEASRCFITSNNVTENSYQGINIRYSNSNTIIDNIIIDSSQHGLAFVGTSSHNLIHHNQFAYNGKEAMYKIDGELRGELTSQGFDEGSNNTWYDAVKEEGNWWSDYSGSGPYAIDGPANNNDLYPNHSLSSQNNDNSLLTIIIIVPFSTIVIVLLVVGYRRVRT